jgi:hypothetical protein
MRRLAPLAAVFALALSAAIGAQSLLVSQASDQIRITAPDFHFLTGKPLERIRNGNSVAFDFQIQALPEARTAILERAFERYVISYDLWEQTYSVSRMRSRRSQGSHFTPSQAETWCLEGMSLPSTRMPKDEPLYFRLEVKAVDGRPNDPIFDEPGLSLSSLIEVFSRAGRGKPADYWRLEAGPIRLRQP